MFPFYNRMAITRMVHDRTAMNGLQVKPDSWYDEQRITNWINTQARMIHRGKRSLELATGEVLAWDQLIWPRAVGVRCPPSLGLTSPASSCSAKRPTHSRCVATSSNTMLVAPRSSVVGCSAWRPAMRFTSWA